jgi:hypothetical protein
MVGPRLLKAIDSGPEERVRRKEAEAVRARGARVRIEAEKMASFMGPSPLPCDRTCRCES